MKIKIIENRHKEHAELLKKNISERISPQYDEEGFQIELRINKKIGKAESYCICGENNSWCITGADVEGLYYGIGKFLHSAKWTNDEFIPNPPKGVVTPDCSFRAVYFAVHFNNWYDEAPIDELEKYLEELMLYGYNTILGIIPIVSINSYEDDFFVRAVWKIRALFALAKKMKMKVGILVVPNQGMMNAPHEWDADPSYEQNPEKPVRGNLGRNICPSVPEALEYLRSIWIKQFEQFEDMGLDYVISWPYDEGGCGCDKCRPWGARGFCDLSKEVYKDAKRFYPNSKFILSNWEYDSPEDEGEFAGLYERLRGDMSFVDYIMVDCHGDFPRYPLEHEVVKPIINFPEMSMWKIVPWGGRGANPQPKRFQRIWDSSKRVLQGGMPYSEGIYEDNIKVQFAGYYWDKNKSYQEILSEYINYELSHEVIDEVLEMMELMEFNHVGVAEYREPDMDVTRRVAELADAVDEKLGERAKQSWRWRILYIRAKIDLLLYEIYWEKHQGTLEKLRRLKWTPEDWLEESEEAQELMQELCKLYHCVDLREDKRNFPTLPSVKGGKVLCKK